MYSQPQKSFRNSSPYFCTKLFQPALGAGGGSGGRDLSVPGEAQPARTQQGCSARTNSSWFSKILLTYSSIIQHMRGGERALLLQYGMAELPKLHFKSHGIRLLHLPLAKASRVWSFLTITILASSDDSTLMEAHTFHQFLHGGAS